MSSEAAVDVVALLRDKRISNLSGLTMDSRQVKPGDIFVAVSGIESHGLEYLSTAISAGASAVLWEDDAEWSVDRVEFLAQSKSIPFICVPDLSRFLGELAHQFFNQPSRDLIMVGITGTNGKTSCTQCIAHAISQTQACGMIGTLGVGMYPEPDRATMTTPDPISVHRAISSMLAKRAAAVVMEVSSHALDQNRVQSVDFDIAVLTNISRDHLDYHGDMAHYIAAKKRLFQVASLSTVVVNLDDPEAEGFVQEAGDNVKVISFGLKPNTASHHINIDDVQLTESGIEFAVHSAWGDASIV